MSHFTLPDQHLYQHAALDEVSLSLSLSLSISTSDSTLIFAREKWHGVRRRWTCVFPSDSFRSHGLRFPSRHSILSTGDGASSSVSHRASGSIVSSSADLLRRQSRREWTNSTLLSSCSSSSELRLSILLDSAGCFAPFHPIR